MSKFQGQTMNLGHKFNILRYRNRYHVINDFWGRNLTDYKRNFWGGNLTVLYFVKERKKEKRIQ
jgi:hypothetical protein